MSAKRFEGKNLEEALDAAAKSFGVESFRVSYHIVLEKRGFLGGTKRVVIEAEVSDKAPSGRKQTSRAEKAVASKPEERNDRRPAQDRPQRARQDERPAAEVVAREEAPRQSERSAKDSIQEHERDREGGEPQRRGGRGRKRRPHERKEVATDLPAGQPIVESSVPVEVPDQGEQSEDAAVVVGWCERIFAISGLDLVARTSETDEEIDVELHGADVLMIGSGDYLDALQVLANKSFTGRQFERRIEFDAGGFKRRREEELSSLAREMAERVRKEKRGRTMRAMSPIERRIVHLALEDQDGVTTESRGRGFLKRVAIIPSGDGEQDTASES